MNLAADPRYHDLREEVDKLGALSGAAVDWRRVESLGAALTRDQPPDLNVVAYTALARFKRSGLPGLREGLAALAALLTTSPPELTPQRPKHRGHALEWLLVRLLPELRDLAPAPAADLQTLAAALRDLRGASRHALGDMSPSFSAIVQVTDALSSLPATPPSPSALDNTAADPPSPAAPALAPPGASSAPLAAAPPSPAAAPAPTSGPVPAAPPSASPQPTAPTTAPASTPSPTAPTAIDPQRPAATIHESSALPGAPLPSVSPPTDLAGLDAFLITAGDALESTARLLRDVAPHDPRAIRLLRAGLWLRLHALPPARPDGATPIPGLTVRDRDQLETLAVHARWPALLARSESLLGAHRLALDLQRFSAAALAGLGPDAAPALLALRAELRALLTRLPELPHVRDRDGRPLADPDTARWLAAEVLPAATSPARDDDDLEFWSGLPARLRGPTRGDALAEAQRRIATSPSEHVRSRRRLALAEACERAGEALAAACFAALADDLRALTVERYDPDLAARCLAGLARAQAHPHALRELVVRLARLDPAAAAAVLHEPPARA